MERILFVNACVRECSRTLKLAENVLSRAGGEIKELNFEKENLKPLTGKLLSERDRLIEKKMWEAPMFSCAREFSEADRIVIAAPFWDLGFPSLLKIYLEAIMVAGITFNYTNGHPTGLCRAKSLKYITTSGGPIFEDFGYTYIKSLAKNFFGISDISCCRAENLDVNGISAEDLLEKATICDLV